jgi:hypothetical protein
MHAPAPAEDGSQPNLYRNINPDTHEMNVGNLEELNNTPEPDDKARVDMFFAHCGPHIQISLSLHDWQVKYISRFLLPVYMGQVQDSSGILIEQPTGMG